MLSCKTEKDDVIKKDSAVAVVPQISLTSVITSGLSAPMQFVHAGDGSKRVFIVQKAGTIRVYDSTFNFISVFGTVSNVSNSGERGLLSMAFHPNYSVNGFVYVYYTNTAGNLELARYHVNSGSPNTMDAASKVIVLTIPHPTNANHNGGELHFGSDGYLYLSTGDGGGSGDVPNNAQNTAVLLGKILRLAVNTSATAPYYTVPAGNPFSNEVYAYGLRNPYRWSFDKATQDMWIGDVGQDSWEEIDFRAAAATSGANYGWRCYEGNATYNSSGCTGTNYIFPVHVYATQNPAASITGGVVYRGAAYPALQGCYLSADFYSGIFYKIVSNGSGWDVTTQTLSPTGIVDFGETESGEVYVVSNTGNSVYRVTSI
ncbi:PQQ-dependent sugar dehydrogenase [Chitinophaga oryziterrae]